MVIMSGSRAARRLAWPWNSKWPKADILTHRGSRERVANWKWCGLLIPHKYPFLS